MIRFSLLSLMGLFMPFFMLAQAEERIYRKFNTQTVLNTLKKNNPDYEKRIRIWEEKLPSIQIDSSKSLQIPIVFHVLATPDFKPPNAEEIKFQLEVLNKAFGSYEIPKLEFPNEVVAQYYTRGVSVGLSFCIPNKVGEVAGINFIDTDVKTWTDFDAVKNPAKGGFAPIDPEHVINVWICDLEGYNAGYALLPDADSAIDGIVIDYDYFGSEKGTAKKPYTEGKTLVHLVGSYLGLHELWNDYDYCKDDKVTDTPVHNAPNDDISTEKEHRHITMCPQDFIEMYMNFMDNTNDTLLSLFTSGQKNRMLAVLSPSGPRSIMGKSEFACNNFNTFETSRQISIKNNQLKLYPNPTNYEVILDMTSTENGRAVISILNGLGAVIKQQNYAMEKGFQRLNIDCSNIPNGLYFVKVQFADQSFVTKNLSIQH
jgi:Secretion system C-terminal sorting domain